MQVWLSILLLSLVQLNVDEQIFNDRALKCFAGVAFAVTGRIDTGRAVRNREYQLDETRLDKEQIVNLSITYCKTIVN
jgi:hypothetical protein